MPPPGGQKSAGWIRGRRERSRARAPWTSAAKTPSRSPARPPSRRRRAPAVTSRPRSMMMRRRRRAATSASRWLERKTVPPPSANRRRNARNAADPLRVEPVERLVQHQHARGPDQRGRPAPGAAAYRARTRPPGGPPPRRGRTTREQVVGPARPARLTWSAAMRRWRRAFRLGWKPWSRTAPTIRAGCVELAVGAPADGRRPRRWAGSAPAGRACWSSSRSRWPRGRPSPGRAGCRRDSPSTAVTAP